MNRLTSINGAGEYFIEDYYGRHYGNEITKLGQLEDLLENADTIRIIKRNGVASLHIDMILDDETYPIAEELFGKEKVDDYDK
jgi:hypothetical protein